MKAYKIEYTEKFPFRYFVEFPSYTVSTTKESNWNNLQNKIINESINDVDVSLCNKLLIAGFTVIKNK